MGLRWRRWLGVAVAGVVTVNVALASFAWLATHRPQPHHGATPEKLGMHATERRVGDTFVWEVAGTGPDTVILFHGYGGTASNLLDEAKWFHGRGYTTLCVDFPGSGESAGTATTLGWHEAEVVRDVRAELGHGRVVLFGQSMGSASILRAVSELGVKADGLILENPYDRLVTTVANRFTKYHLPRWPWAELLVFYGGIELNFDGFALNPVDYANNVTVPSLLLAGAEDERVRPEATAAIAAALGPSCEVELFPKAGHQPMRYADSRLWSQVVGAFLERLPGE